MSRRRRTDPPAQTRNDKHEDEGDDYGLDGREQDELAHQIAETIAAHSGRKDSSGGKDHGWGRLREDPVHFYDARVQEMVDFIAASGIAPLLEAKLARATGRPRLLTVEGLLVSMALCQHRYGGIYFNRVADILHYRISPKWQERFGVKERSDDFRAFGAGYSVVLRLFRNMRALMDPSPVPKNHTLPKESLRGYYKAADKKDLAARRTLLLEVSNAIVEASLAPVRHRINILHLGLDATPVATFARGRKSDGPYTSTDPDAAWYVRDGDHRDPADTPSSSRTGKRPRRSPKYLYGFDLALAVHRDPFHQHQPAAPGYGDPDALPALITGFTLDKPGHKPGRNGIAILKNLERRGYQPGFLAADNLYNSSKPANWQIPVRRLGYKVAYSYRDDQLGIQEQAYGAIQIEGRWYCPEIRRQLINATIDHRRDPDDPDAIDTDTYKARIDARRRFELAPKGSPKSNHQQVLMCPAYADRVQCPRKPASMGTKPHLPLVDIQPSPVDPPKICQQTSITIPLEYDAEHGQHYPYRSPEQETIYSVLRNAVEGMNGFAKDDGHEAIERAQGRRVRGLASQTILLAFQLAAVNQRKIQNWEDTLPGPDNQLPKRRAKPPKKRQTGHPTAA